MTGSVPVTPYWSSPVATLYHGDSAAVLRELPAESVDMAVTSPPFYQLRDYHVDGQIGLEHTPEAWLESLLAVFREVRRVLRPHGTMWVEVGDSYASNLRSGRHESPGVGAKQALDPIHTQLRWKAGGGSHFAWTIPWADTELKPLDLVGIPFRLALALQADGWWLRSVIIWAKPAPMPESVSGWKWEKCRIKIKAMSPKDPRYRSGMAERGPAQTTTIPTTTEWADCPGCARCTPSGGLVLRKGSWRPTEAHSYILMLAKGIPYACFGEAVRETSTNGSIERMKSKPVHMGSKTTEGLGYWKGAQGYDKASGRNLRSVWHITPEPSSLPHFATFPTELPEKCILAGTSEWGNCPRCGLPWAPEVSADNYGDARAGRRDKDDTEGKRLWRRAGDVDWEAPTILSWRSTCACGLSERVPAVVLDPFAGTSSTGVAAQRLGRHYIGIDLSEPYLKMSIKRLEGVPLPMEVSDA